MFDDGRWTHRPYKVEDVQLQAFVDNACTTWLPPGGHFMGMSDEQAGQEIKRLLREQVEIANRTD